MGQTLSRFFIQEKIEYSTVSRSNGQSTYNVDIGVFEDFQKIPFNTYDVVINCATVLPGGDYLDSGYLDKIYKTNILGTQHICKWIESQQSVQHIVNCSTLVVIGKPWPLNLDEYAPTYPTGNHVLYCSSKLTQELIFETFSTANAIGLSQIRFSALYGEQMPWGGIICNFIDQGRSNEKIILINGSKVTADFLCVDDAAKIILAAIKNKFNGILNGASGEEVSLVQLASLIGENLDKTVVVDNVDDVNTAENRANINVDLLNSIIDTKTFTSISAGIKKMMSL